MKVLLVLILLVGCSESNEPKWSEPYKNCLKTEIEVGSMTIMVGKIPTYHRTETEVCKKYSDEFYIDHGDIKYLLEEVKK